MRTVIFDLDGTLADTSGDLVAAANACFGDLGLGDLLDPAADAATAFRGGRAMLRLGFSRAGQGGEAEVDRAFPRLLDHYAAHIDVHTKVYPGAVEALEGLRRAGYLLAVCTNKPEGLAETLLSRLDLRGYFGAVIGADTLPTRKPDAAPYRAAVAGAGGELARSYLLGDTETDRETARAAGVPSALVTFGPSGRGVEALLPEGLLDHYDDLAGLTRRLIG
ncbi:HAD-IA family hydrolase [Sinisalibacter lacisalsi]|uniref:phosphoglycolate phosphatase n=1 Tax=Sinisalibacter lacisalsi TaxID=1526570 RepID=A0ABQ1QTW2_9RHOB|nr:HAD-IA family hydrolase [Sinisalibacter lacisalsi]GGD41318.1 phosphoglycolate phosphatase [Sinisalibacter lacisalsi]